MKRALFIGRFQPFHNAHLIDVKNILKECNEVIIAIGSSREKNTSENPFSFSERRQMIMNTLKNNKIRKYKIYPVPDLYNDKKWVDYIKKKLPKYDYVYSGNTWTLRCFKKYDSKVKKIKLLKGINSTKIRDMMVKDKKWEKLVPIEIVHYIKKINGVAKIQRINSSEYKQCQYSLGPF